MSRLRIGFPLHGRSPIILSALAAACWLSSALQAQDVDPKLAEAGYALAKKYCYGCHGQTYNGSPKFNVLDRESLLITSDNYNIAYMVPGDAENSLFWQRLRDGEMPPENQPQPNDEEKDILKQWIDAGAPTVERQSRQHRYEEDILKAILADLLQTSEVERKYQRYYTLTHLYNNNKNVSDFDLRLYRAAFSKAINSLSLEPEIAIPIAIDPEETIFRVDLRDLGWDQPGYWLEILKAYPYGLRFNKVADREVALVAEQVEQLSGTPLPYVRADWLTVTATRPPLYHFLLRIPHTDLELERFLNVDVAGNFLRNKLKRSGFDKSGVSVSNNRLVERHASRDGYYWKSYDFKQGNPFARLTHLPLGPKFPHYDQFDQFENFAFVADGGEQIFSLPNGLQGYMLIDGQGRRIDEGPTDVVRDLTETAGKVAVVNGISCMHCHKHGMIEFVDEIREGTAVRGHAREKVLELYPPQDDMVRTVARDRTRFMQAIEECIGPFLQVGDDANTPIEQFAEPVGAIARFHFRDLTIEEAAFELGVEDPNELKQAIRFNTELQRLGLTPLMNGAGLDRAAWESLEFINSPFQRVAIELDRGTPVIFK